MTKTVTSADGTRIAFDQVGEGDTLILIGGAVQHRAIDPDTQELARRVADAGFSVINYDRRGRGDSTDNSASDPVAFDPDREVEDVAALIAAAGGSAALYGSSSGSAVALHAAAAGLAVTRLALWEPPLSTGSARGDGVADLAEMQRLAAADDRAGLVRCFSKDFPPQMQTTPDSPMWPVMLRIAPTLAYDTAALVRAETVPWNVLWGSVAVPTLLLRGEPTLPIFAPAIAELVKTLPNVSASVVPGAAWHRWPVEAMASQLVSFLRS